MGKGDRLVWAFAVLAGGRQHGAAGAGTWGEPLAGNV